MAFDPNFTQSVVIRVKEDSTIFGKAMVLAHKTLPVYLCYLVGLAITIQNNIADVDGYIPPAYKTWEHRVLIGAALIVFVDKIWRSRPSQQK